MRGREWMLPIVHVRRDVPDGVATLLPWSRCFSASFRKLRRETTAVGFVPVKWTHSKWPTLRIRGAFVIRWVLGKNVARVLQHSKVSSMKSNCTEKKFVILSFKALCLIWIVLTKKNIITSYHRINWLQGCSFKILMLNSLRYKFNMWCVVFSKIISFTRR